MDISQISSGGSRRGRVTGMAAGVLAFGLLAAAAGFELRAQALELPTPAAAYTDPDPAGSIYPGVMSDAGRTVGGGGRRDRNDPVALAQQGLSAYLNGQRSRGQRDYERALAAGDEGSAGRRYAHWSYGWALYSVGEYREAFEHWRTAEALHGGRPEWVPSTYALALWSLGARELALEFFAIAATQQPQVWGDDAAVAETLQGWRPNERLTMQAVYEAWRNR